ncbi:sterol desaturase/sphingolipid hydroxylase (fatty acid hydroxylase superfamily) [Nocardia tenerifensis]|uniref:Sterol desaturase/sphingolipid hydroxylase (Fatty acid hydroxylase superfamily) n=1 Tax=Nocardia tenerifensis TaxID=228006 RepID=A0A318JX06_9NOCA|nr:sterol desaturase family protein [Nocardia tenerifensis]PXX58733.1 sterol desaturase/sphingolipid hydroxylase (fatty acid hydroxylase superfamily) [Nocardia tenerifensis]
MPVEFLHQTTTSAFGAVPLYLIFVVVEVIAVRVLEPTPVGRPGRGYGLVDTVNSLALGLGSVIIHAVTEIGPLVWGISALYVLTPLKMPTTQWWSWALALLGYDLLYYIRHRASHRVRLLWAGHQVHHSSQYFNLAVALRRKWAPPWQLAFNIPLALLGFSPAMIGAAITIDLTYQFFLHTETVGRLPRWLEFVLNTPSHHRVHHGSDADYLDHNYGAVLIVWDRLFGTFVPETHPATYGLTRNIASDNPLRIGLSGYRDILHDLRDAHTWRERLGYVFLPPGRPPINDNCATVDRWRSWFYT